MSDIRHAVLLSGVPAAGKSTFGRWLEANRGFIHLDLDLEAAPWKREYPDLAHGWNRSIQRRDLTDFIAAMKALTAPLCLDWGYPTSCVSYVDALKRHGCMTIWFDADLDAARRAFIERGQGTVADFTTQMHAITASSEQIRELTDGTTTTMGRDGSRTPAPSIYEDLFPRHAAVIATLEETGAHRIVGIDGGRASGKSHLANHVAGALDAKLIHLDDYWNREAPYVKNLDLDRLRRDIGEPDSSSPVLIEGIHLLAVADRLNLTINPLVYARRTKRLDGRWEDEDFFAPEDDTAIERAKQKYTDPMDIDVGAYHHEFRPHEKADVRFDNPS